VAAWRTGNMRDAAPRSFPCASVALINAFNVRAAGQLISRRNAIIAYRSFPRSAMGIERMRVSNASLMSQIEVDTLFSKQLHSYTSRVRVTINYWAFLFLANDSRHVNVGSRYEFL